MPSLCLRTFIALLASSMLANGLKAQEIPPETQPVLLQMIRDDAIHQELQLSDSQIEQITGLLQEIDGPWFRVRINPAAKRQQTTSDLTAQLQQSLEKSLTPKQLQRLDQLRNQALGTRMIVRDQTAQTLGLTADERANLYRQFRETDSEAMEIQKKLRDGDLDAVEAARKTQALQTKERKRFVDSLSNEQRRQLQSLTGAPFDFSKVMRRYPMAPEITLQGASWLQGSGLTLEDLKGKVVALHFYAFQCINCRRNLPHYNGWHKDYADDGLVVIGIQTPETNAERSPERVSEAIEAEQIQYPVLMDQESSNWKTWSNTMWPTVYLVDKKGFLRRWWQGEMNWKGTEGEKQMRETIEMLLAEDG